MMVMTVPYESTGRTRQKQRTRDALVAATRTLLAHGATPTVEESADASGISRTTAYRYFPNQRTLLLAAIPEIDRASMLDASAPKDVATRLDLVITAQTKILLWPEVPGHRRSSRWPGPDAAPIARLGE